MVIGSEGGTTEEKLPPLLFPLLLNDPPTALIPVMEEKEPVEVESEGLGLLLGPKPFHDLEMSGMTISR